ncbi:MAG: glycosyltransferase family 39 protein [Deltaproteobacteria bacterium]|nr:glycosyltransferase family 39 protein [Deltaproteobacteria bacterium]
MSAPPRAVPRSAIVLLAVAAFALRAFHLNAQNLWYDEIGSVQVIATPVSRLASDFEAGRLEPTAWLSMAYWALTKAVAWPGLGDRDAVLRLTSAALGAATIPALAWATAPILPPGAVVAAAAALALSSFHVWYSQEVRPYVLLILLVTLAVGAWVRALGGGGGSRWAAAAALVVLALYTHPIALALPMILGIHLLSRARADPRRARSGLAALTVAGLAFVPALLLIRAHGANNPADSRGVGWLDLPYVVYAYAVGFSYGPSTGELHDDRLRAVMDSLPEVALAAVIFGALILRGLAATRRLDASTRTLLLTWLALPLGLAFTVAATGANPLNARYGIVSFPAFVILIGLGAADVRRPAVAGLALGAAILSLVSRAQLAFDTRYAKEDCRGLAAALRAEAAPDDLVIVNAPYMAGAVRYYYPGPATVAAYPPTDAERDVDPTRAATDLRALAAGRAHVWLVATRSFHGDRAGTLPLVLGRERTVDRTIELPGIVATRYASPAAR